MALPNSISLQVARHGLIFFMNFYIYSQMKRKLYEYIISANKIIYVKLTLISNILCSQICIIQNQFLVYITFILSHNRNGQLSYYMQSSLNMIIFVLLFYYFSNFHDQIHFTFSNHTKFYWKQLEKPFSSKKLI